ncbi:hypothetical protein V2G26_008680 [Clonostachys chloroleuca]|uniref:Uncharacterized protein n=1 Tax=Clonostachys chloroleuca TaxID=1926264 RepID=A0AA35VD26_9HYPO|nr:unnamed protein product [Clonostachys chloroleuca]
MDSNSNASGSAPTASSSYSQQSPSSTSIPVPAPAQAKPPSTDPFLKDFTLVAEAAKRAQVAVMVRDFEECGFF